MAFFVNLYFFKQPTSTGSWIFIAYFSGFWVKIFVFLGWRSRYGVILCPSFGYGFIVWEVPSEIIWCFGKTTSIFRSRNCKVLVWSEISRQVDATETLSVSVWPLIVTTKTSWLTAGTESTSLELFAPIQTLERISNHQRSFIHTYTSEAYRFWETVQFAGNYTTNFCLSSSLFISGWSEWVSLFSWLNAYRIISFINLGLL